MKSSDKIRVNLDLPEEVDAAVKKKADAVGISKVALIRIAINEYFGK